MKFDDKYPDAKVFDEPELCLIKCDGLMDCHTCHQPTAWAEINFQAPFCSDECLQVVEDDYANYVERENTDQLRAIQPEKGRDISGGVQGA